VGAELARECDVTDAKDGKDAPASSRAGSLPQVIRRSVAAVLLALSCASVAHAAIDAYEFRDDAERARYAELTKELRCPKCQNQDIADSNAPIAADLRKEIFRMLGEGQSNQQIIDFMVDRYGDFVRYKPALSSRTWILWFGPAGLLIGGLLVIGVIVVRRRGQGRNESEALSDEERQRLAHLLDKNRE
jgi:cytochrome c-type biogenesis protein CcmH